jgi:hypothetical protein
LVHSILINLNMMLFRCGNCYRSCWCICCLCFFFFHLSLHFCFSLCLGFSFYTSICCYGSLSCSGFGNFSRCFSYCSSGCLSGSSCLCLGQQCWINIIKINLSSSLRGCGGSSLLSSNFSFCLCLNLSLLLRRKL